ncbi:SGNH/GDSL hydrolase family protein [Coraliomargarita sp. SDUM461004]|uniref:SGNH/GDSL hydrolase family protein n=1 Tax=Thalassobacterium sedimentorum TaxID=3041258 RepID=A0ABU1AIN8_9BACT|nr:GDSL-type esterase/lipase family protein [Coraliomargarita sp. SDUM461004]MDQ8194679.1 SGNH/GDSL hydrolase family protein [Coraliomargarita sp. SDUM461004]
MKLPTDAITHNIAELISHPETGQRVISRIPQELREHLNEHAQQRALHSSGCELRFRLTGPTATLRLQASEVIASHHGGGLAQILFGDFSHTYFPVLENKLIEYEITAPNYNDLEQASAGQQLFNPHLVRILLPTHAAINHLEIVGAIAPPAPGDIPTKRVLNYGSSITQGTGALSSRETWAGRCAHLLGADLINLGFGGGCHCEPEMTEYLCQRNDFDVAILETGINMLALDPKVTDQRIEHLIREFSAAHSDKPVFCLGVFPCNEDSETNFQGRAQQIRKLVQGVVQEIQSPTLTFIDGREALTHSLNMSVDLTHPSQAGMIEIGAYVAARIQASGQI